MGNNYNDDEVEIDLAEMFFYVLKKWKVIVIWGIIGLLLGCGFSYYKMVQKDPANLEAYFEKLEEDAPDKVNEDNITIYRDYKALYDGLLEYGKTSVVLNMNPNEVYSASANYYYSCEDIKAVESYLNSFLDTAAYESLVESSGLECNTNDIKEMVGFWFSKPTENNLIVDSARREEEQIGNLGISVFAPTKEALDGMMTQLKTLVDSANKELKQNGEKFESYKLNENESFGYSNSVVNRQQSYISNRVSYLKNATDYMDKFSDDEKLYVAYYYSDEDTELESYFSKKIPVFVAVGLAFVVAVVYVVIFIFDGHVKSEDDLGRDTYTIAYLGGKKNKGLDKVFENWSNKNKPKVNDNEYVAQYISAMDADKVALVYDDNDEEIKAIVAYLKEKLVDKAELLGDISQNAATGNELKNIKECIGIVKLYSTRKTDYNRLKEVCANYQTELKKAIIVR